MTADPLLHVDALSVLIRRPGREVAALNGVSFTVGRGEVVGLVGESGGGKSMVARAVVGMLPAGSEATGQVDFAGTDVLRMTPSQLQHHRGEGAAICFQNPRGALAPTRTVGAQLMDRLRTHQHMDRDRAHESAREIFAAVGIRGAAQRLQSYPHELSGGMAQRVMISLATGCAPGLLVADEPTTGLDVTLTREILRQFRHAADTDGRGVLLISHDLASIAEVCDRVVVLYAGTVVEAGPAAQVLTEPSHPYTRALLASVPDVDGRRVVATGGGMPLLTAPPQDCPFAPRCAHASDECRAARPALTPIAAGWELACFHPRTGALGRSTVPAPPVEVPDASPVLVVTDAHVVYGSRFGSGGHHALRGVSLTVQAGETVGVVGESGSGKSTLARLALGLVTPTEGTVQVGGTDPARRSRADVGLAAMVFQDPVGSLSPRRTVADSVAEPLRAAGVPAAERTARVEAVVDRMGLDRSILTRRPHELSGGQAQRVGIARALVGRPRLIVFDEPTSALDVTVQAQILEVIAEVAADAAHGSVFISHDLATVRGFCDRVVVLYLGQVVEEGPVEAVFTDPQHPYTRALLGSTPRLGAPTTPPGLAPSGAAPAVVLVADLDEHDADSGCPLAARCPFVTDRCRREAQVLQPYGESRAACWRIPELPTLIAGGEPPS